MKLYYSKGACSLAPHIVLAELNMVYEIESVDLKAKTCVSGDFRKINPKGSVPALRMENGEILTEGSVISQYLADQKPEAGLLPRFGTTERYRCQEWLNFIGTELHKNFTPLFMPQLFVKSSEAQTELKAGFSEVVKMKITQASAMLGTNDYVMGKTFSIADAYLFTVLGWTKYVGIDLGQWPNLGTFMKRVSERPGVMRALKEEGLL